jgi:hypothetical protein
LKKGCGNSEIPRQKGGDFEGKKMNPKRKRP